MLGEAFLLNDQLEEGVHELRLAVTLNPDSDAAHQGLGTALFQLAKSAAAEKEFREALRLNASPDNHLFTAACLMTMDRYEEALAELDAAARLDPERTALSRPPRGAHETDEGNQLPVALRTVPTCVLLAFSVRKTP